MEPLAGFGPDLILIWHASMIAVIINITLERQTNDHQNRFEEAVSKNPEIRE